jgi:hypothetical protein
LSKNDARNSQKRKAGEPVGRDGWGFRGAAKTVVGATFVSAQLAKAAFSERKRREFRSGARVSVTESPRNAACRVVYNLVARACSLNA